MTTRFARAIVPWLLPAALLVVAAALVAAQASRPSAVFNMWRPWGEIGILAVAMTPIILTGGIDLSVGAVMALAGVTLGACWQAGMPMPWAAAAAVGVGFVAGAINGTLVTLGIAPLVATLATMAFYAGLAMAIATGQRVPNLPEPFTSLGQGAWLGVPTQLMLFALAWLVALVIVHHTRFGRYLYAIGDNPLAAEFAAVPVRRVQWALYAASGTTAALVALVSTARGGAATPSGPVGIELATIACVVLGGTRVTGAVGGMGRTLLGVTVLSLVDIGVQLVPRVQPPWSGQPWQITGEIRLLAVGLLVIGVAIWNQRAGGTRYT
jgi:ribose/xylose/arabinose/galactoside ABC-type transport system permease subunit